MNLMEGLTNELKRNKELLKMYEALGPVGNFGAAFIREDILRAEKAIREGDTVAMLRVFTSLKEHK